MKKILTIIALSLVGIIGAGVITLAFVKTNYGQLSTSNIEEIVVYYGTENNTFTEEDEIYNTLLEKFDASNKETILSSLFQGAYSKDAKPAVEKLSWTFSTSTDTMYLKFNFNSDNYPMIKVDGENYIDDTLTTDDQTVEYKSVYITVENTSTLTTVTAYFVQAENNDTTTSSNYRITYVAHQEALYDYITELSNDSYLR